MYAITLAAVWRVRYVHTAALRVRACDVCTGYGTCAPYTWKLRYRHVNRNLSNRAILRYALSLLRQDICSFSLALIREIELEITIKRPTWFDAISSCLVPFLHEISCAEWSRIPRIVSQQFVYMLLERPDNFLGTVNRIRVPI